MRGGRYRRVGEEPKIFAMETPHPAGWVQYLRFSPDILLVGEHDGALQGTRQPNAPRNIGPSDGMRYCMFYGNAWQETAGFRTRTWGASLVVLQPIDNKNNDFAVCCRCFVVLSLLAGRFPSKIIRPYNKRLIWNWTTTPTCSLIRSACSVLADSSSSSASSCSRNSSRTASPASTTLRGTGFSLIVGTSYQTHSLEPIIVPEQAQRIDRVARQRCPIDP